ncbi:MAG: hypothetical protein K0U98_13255 [Deltaproteobacteria bacterium]|nr:hypothetical protein [Deltaproteobacteria bacterium]
MESIEENVESPDPSVADAPPPPTPPPAPALASDASGGVGASPLSKNPFLAGFLSFFPSLGHIYNGLYLRAFVFFAAFAFCVQLVDRVDHPVFGMAAAFVWFFGVLDSFRQATLINMGLATDLGTLDRPRKVASANGPLFAGVAIFLVGFLEMVSRYGLWDWDWLVEYWFVVLMIVGLGMVISALKRRAAGGDEDSILTEGGY